MSETDNEDDDSNRSWLDRVADLFSGEPTSRRDLMQVLRDSAQRELIDADALNIMYGAVQVSDMQVRDVMIPRSQLVTVHSDSDPHELLPKIIESQHSRFPVVGEGLDDIKGILHAKDLLPLLMRDDWESFNLKDCTRSATMVPESKRLNVLLKEFRENRNHMAIVVDEYGRVSGAVTIEDVLEQIVGEIEDEHDVDDDSFIKALDTGSFTVKATTAIEDFNEYFESEFDDSEFDTIGGLVLKELGHLPRRDEVVNPGTFQFKVLNADSRRIRLLHVSRGRGRRARRAG